MLFTKNEIENAESFNPYKFPQAVKELGIIYNATENTGMYYKPEIIITFLKDHCIKNDWITANPQLAKLLTSGYFSTKHIESVFELFRSNKFFIQDFEKYIKDYFKSMNSSDDLKNDRYAQ